MRSAGFNAPSPQRLARTRIIIIRPPRHRHEIAAMGQKRRSRECSSPTKTSAPAPSSFIFPRPRSHFPRIPFGGAHEDFGLPQQQLSTMGYPRKSYPHRCSPPCAKRSRPRACARVYIIYRSPVGRSRGVFAPLWGRGRAVVPPWPAPACAGWGRAKAKADAPRAATRTFPAYGRAPATYGRITVRKGGSAQGKPRPCPCALPASARLRPRPRPLMGEAPSAGWGRAKAKADAPLAQQPAPVCLLPRPRRLNGHPASAGGRENDRMAHRRTTTPTHRTQRGNDTCTIRVT